MKYFFIIEQSANNFLRVLFAEFGKISKLLNKNNQKG